ncbi:tetratricopeptide repeat protein [Luteolibacter sp. Populi]|uniref:tetratricopeptide repeat protein n=1 Tax=Luteolibacter sp. Populi TaxID=3230487 RepID=UPI0034674AF1
MIRLLLCLAATATALAQQVPRAQPVDENEAAPPPRPDPAADWYAHGKRLHDSAKASAIVDQKLDRYTQAISVLSRFIEEKPNDPNAEAAWWYLGESYYGCGRVDDARRCYHGIISRFGKGGFASAAAFRLAVDHFNNRQYALAAPLFEKMVAVSTAPDHRLKGLFYAAFSYELQGRTREATEYYRKVMTDPEPLNPFLSKTQLHLGKLLARAEKLDEALPLLDQAVMSRSPSDVRGPAAVEAGIVAAKLGQADVSDKYLMLVLNTAGMEAYRPDAQIALMNARYDSKQYGEVISIFLRSAEKAAGEQEARRLMVAAKSYMELERNVEALELFREVEKLMLPNNIHAFEANYLRVLCFYRIEGRHIPDQVDAFLDIYRKNRPRDPKIHTALLMKAETLMDERKPTEAAKVYNEIDATVLSPENRKGLLYKRATCSLASEDPAGAVRSFSEFITNYPDDPRAAEALMQRAQAYKTSGEPTKAIADFDQVITRDSTAEFTELAYLESAEIARQESNLEDMIARYEGFLMKFPGAVKSRKAKAHYWVAWGMTKKDRLKEAIPHAGTARELEHATYGKNAGALLALAHWTLQAPEALCEDVDTAIKEDFVDYLPEQLIDWAAMQAFSADRYEQSARFYGLIADEDEPRSTAKQTWRYLGKALLAAGKPKEALGPVNNALEVEDAAMWKADGLVDRAKALLGIGNVEGAAAALSECRALQPQGRTIAEVMIVNGDIHMKRNDPARAAIEYVSAIEQLDDNDRVLKPMALHKAALALDKKQDPSAAADYRMMLKTKYPEWKAP